MKKLLVALFLLFEQFVYAQSMSVSSGSGSASTSGIGYYRASKYEFFTDFGATASAYDLSFSITGTGSSFNAGGVQDNVHIGVTGYDAGTTTTGRAIFRVPSGASSSSLFNSGNGEITFETLIRTPANLSDGTDTYYLYYGIPATTNGFDQAAETTDGIYFRYTHSENSGKWQYITRASSAETVTDSTVTVAINTWYKLKVVVNAAGTNATFTVNGANSSTVSTNFPATSAGYIFSGGIRKTLGTAVREAFIDYVYASILFTSGR